MRGGVPASRPVCEDVPCVTVASAWSCGDEEGPAVEAMRVDSGSGVGEACVALELKRPYRVDAPVPFCGVLGSVASVVGWDASPFKGHFSAVASGGARPAARRRFAKWRCSPRALTHDGLVRSDRVRLFRVRGQLNGESKYY